jgi:hypothetical protein
MDEDIDVNEVDNAVTISAADVESTVAFSLIADAEKLNQVC